MINTLYGVKRPDHWLSVYCSTDREKCLDAGDADKSK